MAQTLILGELPDSPPPIECGYGYSCQAAVKAGSAAQGRL